MGKFEKGKRPTQAQSYAEPQRAPKKKKQKPTYMWVITGILAAFLIVGIGFGMAAIFRSCNSGSRAMSSGSL